MLTKKDYQAIADILNRAGTTDHPDKMTLIAEDLCEYFIADNILFNEGRFWREVLKCPT